MCSGSGEHISSPVSQTNQQQETTEVRPHKHKQPTNQRNYRVCTALVRLETGMVGPAALVSLGSALLSLVQPSLTTSTTNVTGRAGRFLNLFSVIRFSNTPCLAPAGLNGTCYTGFGLKLDIDTDEHCREAVRGAGRGGGRGLRGRLRSLLHLLSPMRGADTGEQHLPHHRHLQQLLHLHRLPLQPPGYNAVINVMVGHLHT